MKPAAHATQSGSTTSSMQVGDKEGLLMLGIVVRIKWVGVAVIQVIFAYMLLPCGKECGRYCIEGLE